MLYFCYTQESYNPFIYIHIIQILKDMRYLLFFLLSIVITGCVGTDVVDDQIVDLSISVEDRSLVNNATAAILGDEYSFSAKARNDRGSEFEPSVVWNSSNSGVAQIDSSGNLSTLTRGTTTITATGLGIQSNQVKVTVVESLQDVALIEVSGSKSMLNLDETLNLSARALNAVGQEISNVDITWESTDSSIASVSSSGTVTAHNNGSADIVASADQISGNYPITVGQPSERMGQFESLNGYQTSGSVTLTLGNSEVVNINLGDDFSADNGPGLYVYLSNNRSSISGGVEIGKLRSNNGADTYIAPSDVTLDEYDFVLIYCRPFGVGFGSAKLGDGS